MVPGSEIRTRVPGVSDTWVPGSTRVTRVQSITRVIGNTRVPGYWHYPGPGTYPGTEELSPTPTTRCWLPGNRWAWLELFDKVDDADSAPRPTLFSIKLRV